MKGEEIGLFWAIISIIVILLIESAKKKEKFGWLSVLLLLWFGFLALGALIPTLSFRLKQTGNYGGWSLEQGYGVTFYFLLLPLAGYVLLNYKTLITFSARVIEGLITFSIEMKYLFRRLFWIAFAIGFISMLIAGVIIPLKDLDIIGILFGSFVASPLSGLILGGVAVLVRRLVRGPPKVTVRGESAREVILKRREIKLEREREREYQAEREALNRKRHQIEKKLKRLDLEIPDQSFFPEDEREYEGYVDQIMKRVRARQMAQTDRVKRERVEEARKLYEEWRALGRAKMDLERTQYEWERREETIKAEEELAILKLEAEKAEKEIELEERREKLRRLREAKQRVIEPVSEEERKERETEEAVRDRARRVKIEIEAIKSVSEKARALVEEEERIKKQYPPEVAERILDLIDKMMTEEG